MSCSIPKFKFPVSLSFPPALSTTRTRQSSLSHRTRPRSLPGSLGRAKRDDNRLTLSFRSLVRSHPTFCSLPSTSPQSPCSLLSSPPPHTHTRKRWSSDLSFLPHSGVVCSLLHVVVFLNLRFISCSPDLGHRLRCASVYYSCRLARCRPDQHQRHLFIPRPKHKSHQPRTKAPCDPFGSSPKVS